jgi:hypothetical protein
VKKLIKFKKTKKRIFISVALFIGAFLILMWAFASEQNIVTQSVIGRATASISTTSLEKSFATTILKPLGFSSFSVYAQGGTTPISTASCGQTIIDSGVAESWENLQTNGCPNDYSCRWEGIGCTLPGAEWQLICEVVDPNGHIVSSIKSYDIGIISGVQLTTTCTYTLPTVCTNGVWKFHTKLIDPFDTNTNCVYWKNEDTFSVAVGGTGTLPLPAPTLISPLGYVLFGVLVICGIATLIV